ncbi:jerky protein homolog-like [Teleopsis dalmanni]|uniref:jerky protein homolog-like n=1 Tax=Teleopsis dalmanni TaxID=139649 RepID=UPI0018CEFC5A|nr:jerky protein homolog-like [Teleopsis dalmanni]
MINDDRLGISSKNDIISVEWHCKGILTTLEDEKVKKLLHRSYKEVSATDLLFTNSVYHIRNTPSHPAEKELIKVTEDGTISTIFLPPNVTPLLQPMDQNVIRLVKLHYRNSLLSKIVAEGCDNISSALKQVNIYDAVSLLSFAWQKLSEDLIKKCWANILSFNSIEFDEEDDIPLAQLIPRTNDNVTETTITLLQNVFSNCDISTYEVNKWNNADNTIDVSDEDDGSDDENIEENNLEINKHEDAINHFEKCIKWAINNNETSKLAVLRELQEKAVQKNFECSKKQTKINDFFYSTL